MFDESCDTVALAILRDVDKSFDLLESAHVERSRDSWETAVCIGKAMGIYEAFVTYCEASDLEVPDAVKERYERLAAGIPAPL